MVLPIAMKFGTLRNFDTLDPSDPKNLDILKTEHNNNSNNKWSK